MVLVYAETLSKLVESTVRKRVNTLLGAFRECIFAHGTLYDYR
jgi:hypothetical protein